jgi:hypothetical protein
VFDPSQPLTFIEHPPAAVSDTGVGDIGGLNHVVGRDIVRANDIDESTF